MILRLWVVTQAVRYLKYVPILGWRLSDRIQRQMTDLMDGDIDVAAVDLDLAGDLPAAAHVSVDLTNGLPSS
ncbi:hypothetical protein ACFQH6_15940 [Halobacteriaceae archaeon GCM10025711]